MLKVCKFLSDVTYLRGSVDHQLLQNWVTIARASETSLTMMYSPFRGPSNPLLVPNPKSGLQQVTAENRIALVRDCLHPAQAHHPELYLLL